AFNRRLAVLRALPPFPDPGGGGRRVAACGPAWRRGGRSGRQRAPAVRVAVPERLPSTAPTTRDDSKPTRLMVERDPCHIRAARVRGVSLPVSDQRVAPRLAGRFLRG